jgi:DNA-binding CsgD family transcriptional regulator
MMTGRLTVRGRDLRALAGMVSEDRGEPAAAGLAPSLLSDLLGLIRSDYLAFNGLDSRQQAHWLEQSAGAEPCDGEEEPAEAVTAFWRHYWSSICSYPERTGDVRSVVKTSDFYSARQWRGSGMYQEYVRPGGIEHEMLMTLPAEPGWTAGPRRTLRLIFFRGPGPDFSERDRALLTLLRPHLHQAYADAERRRRTSQLTCRQQELLRLVGSGHTNAQIARRLGVSEGTVRKHLENIYGRLGVSSRTAAVTRAFPDQGTS